MEVIVRLKFLLSRLLRYYRNNGLLKTIKKAVQKFIQSVFLNTETLFYIDLSKLSLEKFRLPEGYAVESIQGREWLRDKDMKILSDYIGRDEMEYEVERRFSKNAILWLAKYNDHVTAFIWSIKHLPLEPYFFPIGENDVLLFDGAVMPEYRGRNIYPMFLTKIFHVLKEKGMTRVFIDAYKWNKSALHSVTKTPARKLCDARKINCLGRTIVIWNYH